jgi:hypothetical protein
MAEKQSGMAAAADILKRNDVRGQQSNAQSQAARAGGGNASEGMGLMDARSEYEISDEVPMGESELTNEAGNWCVPYRRVPVCCLHAGGRLRGGQAAPHDEVS